MQRRSIEATMVSFAFPSIFSQAEIRHSETLENTGALSTASITRAGSGARRVPGGIAHARCTKTRAVLGKLGK
jgi:hypothetical protein